VKLFLIRHGQTSWNAQHRVMGRQEIPLDVHGEKQARDIAQVLTRFPIQKIISSPQLRAQQTAQYLALEKNLPVVTDGRVAELDFRRWEGKTTDELRVDPVYVDRKNDFFSFEHPEVESFKSLTDRLHDFLRQVSQTQQNFAVVSHADVIRALLIQALNLPTTVFFQFKIQNGSCSILSNEGNRWVTELVNYTPVPLSGLDI
jgi:phosphoserine phosphatase